MFSWRRVLETASATTPLPCLVQCPVLDFLLTFWLLCEPCPKTALTAGAVSSATSSFTLLILLATSDLPSSTVSASPLSIKSAWYATLALATPFATLVLDHPYASHSKLHRSLYSHIEAYLRSARVADAHTVSSPSPNNSARQSRHDGRSLNNGINLTSTWDNLIDKLD